MAGTVSKGDAGERTPFIAGNWKMNLDHLQAIAFVQKLAWTLQDARHDYGQTEVAVFPPFTDLRSVQTLISADKLELGYGAQDVSAHVSGAYTGEVSAQFLKALEVQYVLIGHSERRQYHHETDEILSEKVALTLANGMVPVICVGETAEDLDLYGPSAVPVSQLHAALALAGGATNIVVAYEPVWAIGSGRTPTLAEIEDMHGAIRAAVYGRWGGDGFAPPILYGGSVRAENAAQILRLAEVGGALVGGASLTVAQFLPIVRAA